MPGIYEELKARGFVYQCTDEAGVTRLLEEGKTAFYVGFDPTADSLHVGSLIPIIAMAHLQRAGHFAIVVVGGGTALVGDPSGKTEMRQMLLEESVRANGAALGEQLGRFLVLDGERGLAVDNTAWLRDLKYIDFLRDIGRHFSVNRMLAAESYRQRLDTGLSFLEFNYMLLQSYDFLVLYQKHRCLLQLGGQDQWGNIVAGSDLIRRVEGAQAYGLTFPLLTSSTGEKFGKSVAGAVWLSAERTSTFDFYQFWRNVEDRDVERLLKLFTFLPVEECERLGRLVPPLLNRAKEILAYEVTRFVHGAEAAAEAYLAATAHFPSADPTRSVPTSSGLMALGGGEDRSLPELALSALQLAAGLSIADLLVLAGMATSKGEARRLVRQGGVRLADQPVTDENLPISPTLLSSSPILKAGKKRMVRLTAGSGAKGAS